MSNFVKPVEILEQEYEEHHRSFFFYLEPLPCYGRSDRQIGKTKSTSFPT